MPVAAPPYHAATSAAPIKSVNGNSSPRTGDARYRSPNATPTANNAAPYLRAADSARLASAPPTLSAYPFTMLVPMLTPLIPLTLDDRTLFTRFDPAAVGALDALAGSRTALTHTDMQSLPRHPLQTVLLSLP